MEFLDLVKEDWEVVLLAGAEKKDERVLVPDLGSLTSIYDRRANCSTI
ncbi:unnamed protein product [Rhodiola kirilowii]